MIEWKWFTKRKQFSQYMYGYIILMNKQTKNKENSFILICKYDTKDQFIVGNNPI